MRLVLDVENTTQTREGKLHLDPFEPENSLTMVGLVDADSDDSPTIYTYDHAEKESPDSPIMLQETLDKTTLLIMHNAQHDLQWLWSCGFKYNGDIYDTMLSEYILCRGLKKPLSLEACAERYRLQWTKQDTLKQYFKKGYNTREIPILELAHYLDADIRVTRELFLTLDKRYKDQENHSLVNVLNITNEVCRALTKMYMNGLKVSRDTLYEVKEEFEKERNEILDALEKTTKELMGDTPINLNSPEQVSQLIFSRRVLDKNIWGEELFEHTSTDKEFRKAIAENTSIMYKTKAYMCEECKGNKYVHKTRKDGSLFKKPTKCKSCDATGYHLIDTNRVAGLRFTAPSKTWVSANGFSTSKGNIEKLETLSKSKGLGMQQDFLRKLRRLSALETYLNTYIKSIDIFTKQDGFLHVGLTQHITSTGRFSGRNPNMQNMPRGGTFPVKKVFVSRWDGGKIMEADFAQLEFRVAAFLGQDKTAMEEVSTGFDVHAYTAKVISDAGQPTSRQEAKAHTFAPLYGASGYGRTPAEAAYYQQFTTKYNGIARWHSRLANEAINTGRIQTPSGRQYEFENMKRRMNGSVTNFTMIKNYPVQGFATADVVPIVLLEFEKLLDKHYSCLVNTVHDSIVVDVHPNEEHQVIAAVETLNENLHDLINKYYGIDFNVPLLLEAKIGPNWLETKDV
jgi:DNA polymerase I-like protein with 3'-5' exonuclease and polymerase domains